MANEPIQGLPYPDLTGVPPNVPEHIKALADAIAPRSVMRFASIAARDAALPTPVDGMVCYIAADNGYYARVGGQWRVLWQDTGPIALTIVAGTGQYSPTVRRIGYEVALDGAIQQAGGSGRPAIANATWTTVATLPAGMRPPKFQYYPASITTAGIAVGVRVQTNGDVEVWFGATTGAYIPLTGVRFRVN